MSTFSTYYTRFYNIHIIGDRVKVAKYSSEIVFIFKNIYSNLFVYSCLNVLDNLDSWNSTKCIFLSDVIITNELMKSYLLFKNKFYLLFFLYSIENTCRKITGSQCSPKSQKTCLGNTTVSIRKFGRKNCLTSFLFELSTSKTLVIWLLQYVYFLQHYTIVIKYIYIFFH